MIPLWDTSRSRGVPLAMYGLVAVNVAVFVHESEIPSSYLRNAFINDYALIPFDLTHGVEIVGAAVPTIATLVTSQFLHGSVLHIFFNMLFLVVFGPFVESTTGHLGFIAFYLVCGVLGGLAQMSADPLSHVPSIGASGAIAGVLGGYLVRFPTSNIETLVPIGCFPLFLRLPAILVIGMWAVVQFVHGFGPLSSRVLSEQGGGIAYFAHIGGFLAGVLLIAVFTSRPRERRAG